MKELGNVRKIQIPAAPWNFPRSKDEGPGTPSKTRSLGLATYSTTNWLCCESEVLRTRSRTKACKV